MSSVKNASKRSSSNSKNDSKSRVNSRTVPIKAATKSEHKARTTKTKEPSKPKKAPAKVVIQQPVANDYYSDDFEDEDDDKDSTDDEKLPPPQKLEEVPIPVLQKPTKPPIQQSSYESDFEDDENNSDNAESEVESIPLNQIENPTPLLKRLADREENQISNSKTEHLKDYSKEAVDTVASPSLPINFTSATLNLSESYPSNEKRLKKLQELIKLETTRTVLLNLLPNKEHDFYLELFGASGRKQASVQTNDDDVSEMTQTDQKDSESKSTQHPATIDNYNEVTNDNDNDLSIFKRNHLDNPHLKQFASVASQVILELTSAQSTTSKHAEMKNMTNLSFSKGFNLLVLPSTLKGRVSCTCKSGTSSDFVFVSSYIMETIVEELIAKSLIIEYSIDNSEPPKSLHFAEGDVTALAGSDDNSLLCAGLKDGSVLLYDLLGKNNNDVESVPWLDSPEPIPLRRADFDTSFYSLEINGTNSAPIVDIKFIPNADTKGSQQIAVLDQSARLWIYSCHKNGSSMAKGMSPGGQLYMTLSALIRPDSVISRNASMPTAIIANCLAICNDPVQFIIGTDIGFLTTISKSKLNQNVPRLYKDKTQFFGEVTCIKPSILRTDLLLAGLSNGCISVYSLQRSSAITTITPPASSRRSVVAIEWCPT